MNRSNANVISVEKSSEAFDIQGYMAKARRLLPSLDESDTWIRSGIHIHDDYKHYISSYRLLGSQRPAIGRARVEALLIKTQVGTKLSDAEKPCVDFIGDYLARSGVDAALAALVPSTGGGWRFFFISSPKLERIEIPEDVLNYICTSAVKNYLKKRCGLSNAALDGYLSPAYALFDDTPIRARARDMDKALRDVKYCDIACGTGRIAFAMADRIAALRFDLNKYIGGAERSEKRFRDFFLTHSLYATDYDAGCLEVLKATARLGLEEEKELPENRFAWGNILIEELFSNAVFDIVATNPPHMKQEEFSIIKDRLTDFAAFANNADLYCFYAERAFGLAREGGSLALFMSNRWMRSEYGGNLRKFLSCKNISEIVDYGNIPTVKNVATPMSIISALNEPPSGSFNVATVSDTDYDDISAFAEEHASSCPSSRLTGEGWAFDSKDTAALMTKILSAGRPLGEYVEGRLYRGILTGLNEAFTLSAADAEELLRLEPDSADILRPFLSGRNVKRYSAPTVKKYLIFIPKGFTNANRGETQPWEWLSSKYPAAAARLAKYEKKAEARRDKGDYWWELRSCKYYDAFGRPKIICPSIVRQISATMDKSGLYSNDKTSVVAADDYYLLGLLNSSLMDFYFRRISAKLLNDHYELKPANLAKLPIREVSPTNSFQVRLYTEIERGAMELSSLCAVPKGERTDEEAESIRKTERAINKAVCRLYKLTPQEINIVENN